MGSQNKGLARRTQMYLFFLKRTLLGGKRRTTFFCLRRGVHKKRDKPTYLFAEAQLRHVLALSTIARCRGSHLSWTFPQSHRKRWVPAILQGNKGGNRTSPWFVVPHPPHLTEWWNKCSFQVHGTLECQKWPPQTCLAENSEIKWLPFSPWLPLKTNQRGSEPHGQDIRASWVLALFTSSRRVFDAQCGK